MEKLVAAKEFGTLPGWTEFCNATRCHCQTSIYKYDKKEKQMATVKTLAISAKTHDGRCAFLQISWALFLFLSGEKRGSTIS